MLTNKLKVDFNFNKIDQDFDIFLVEKQNKDYYKYNILDSALYDFKAVAVQYAFGAKALVLFKKNEISERDFRVSITTEYPDVRIQKIDVFDEEQCSKHFYYGNRLLVQLLLNSMRTPKNEKFRYNNLTGKLLYSDPSLVKRNKDKVIKYVNFLEIVIDPGMYLNLDLKTYKKCDNDKKSSLFVFDEVTYEFRKKLKDDNMKDVFTEGSMLHNHFSIENFSIDGYEKFKKSKLGIMEKFLRDVQEKLNKYISLHLCEREEVQAYEITKLEKKGITEKEYGNMLKKRGVVIINETHTDQANILVSLLHKELNDTYDVEAEIGNLDKDKYNIRIIHDEKFYEEYEEYDPHKDNLHGFIVQHFTEEIINTDRDKKNLPQAIKKVIQELLIKGDVRDKKVSIYDWTRLDSGKEWNFVIKKKIINKKDENCEHVNTIGKSVKNYFDYYWLKINQDGEMKFEIFSDINIGNREDWKKICLVFDQENDKQFGVKNIIDGLVFSDINNIHCIIQTKEKTIPNIFALRDTLMQTIEKDTIDKTKLIENIDSFLGEYPEYQKFVEQWLIQLADADDVMTKKQVKKLLNMRTDAASQFNRYLHNKEGIWIDGELRKEEFEMIYQISSMMNIKFQYYEDLYKNEKSFLYYVGAKSKKLSYPNACCIRKVISHGESLEYEEVLPLMAVEFVRNSQFTVLPFPFKYLREFMEQC